METGNFSTYPKMKSVYADLFDGFGGRGCRFKVARDFAGNFAMRNTGDIFGNTSSSGTASIVGEGGLPLGGKLNVAHLRAVSTKRNFPIQCAANFVAKTAHPSFDA